MVNYMLMHKDVPCGTIIIDEDSGSIFAYKDNHSGNSPFLGNTDLKKLKKWWEARSVPASRAMIQDVMKKTGCINPEVYLAKNLALSMTDAYWLCPYGESIRYDEIKFSNLQYYNEGKVPYHNMSSYDPNASLGGEMEKYWEFSKEGPILVKESSKYFGQQSVNEVFASFVHKLQGTEIPYTQYQAYRTSNNSILCKCHSFTSDSVELIPAYEILESQKLSNDLSTYEQYIEICARNGIDREQIQDYMDYQTLTDFILSNTDEHMANFGILRNPDTLELIGPAPIFDSGNSMFYRECRELPYTRVELLQRSINSFYKTEEKMLTKVKNRNIVKLDLLPSPRQVRMFYEKADIPEEKISFIEKNYETKLQMVQEFQRGLTISLYHEKQAEKTATYRKEEKIIDDFER